MDTNQMDHGIRVSPKFISAIERWKDVLPKKDPGNRPVPVAEIVRRKRFSRSARTCFLGTLRAKASQESAMVAKRSTAFESSSAGLVRNAFKVWSDGAGSRTNEGSFSGARPQERPDLYLDSVQASSRYALPARTNHRGSEAGAAARGVRYDSASRGLQNEPPRELDAHGHQGFRDLTEVKLTRSAFSEASVKTEPSMEGSGHVSLDTRVKELLSRLLDIRLDGVKIYTNQMADAVAKKYSADAVTRGNAVLFREGKYSPWDKAGIALIGHEMTHVAQANRHLQPNPGRFSPRSSQTDEVEALENEQTILRYFSRGRDPAGNIYQDERGLANGVLQAGSLKTGMERARVTSPALPRSEHPPAGSSRGTQAQAPKPALSSRDASVPPEPMNQMASFTLAEQQLRLIKDEVYRDLLDRIRSEFERGG